MAEKAWGGVFDEATDSRVERFTESVSFDRRLYAHDIAGSIAHTRMLAEVGLIAADELQFGRIFDRNDSVVVRNETGQRVQ